jgi:2-dehydro-3-deoxygalactonokinase
LAIEADWIAVDWGTSNLRAWGIGASGDLLFSRSSDQGMGKLTPDAYPMALTELIAGDVSSSGPPIDVLICGMAGARQGWREAPYLDAPAELSRLAFGAVTPSMPEGSRLKPSILPGVCQKFSGNEDVMRGEETQLLGLCAMNTGYSGLVVMPGTHSKWVALSGTRIERFSTSMTGELFDILRTHSVLRHSVNGDTNAPDREAGLEAGLAIGLEVPARLTANLFKIRAGSLLSGHNPAWCTGFLSGLLIGSEIGGQRESIGDGDIPLVGGDVLCALYARGFAMIGVGTRIIDATEATLAGLKAARRA